MSKFAFDIAAECFEKSGGSPEEDRRIGGLVSTSHLDRHAERVLQEGLDFGPFLKSGWFNDNHDPATDAVLGYPQSAQLVTLPDGQRGWYVEGFMLKGYPRADRVWQLAQTLQKSNRKLGFSVEGQTYEKDEKGTIRKAVVNEVAITRCPVNTQTSLMVLAKSLAAGDAVSAPVVAEPGDGFALRPQSLEQTRKKKKKLTKAEAVALIKSLNPAFNDEFAGRIVDFTIRWHNG